MMISVYNARKLATWHVIALISDVLTVTIMDTLQQIALTKYHLQAHQQDAGTTPLIGMTESTSRNQNHTRHYHHDNRDWHRLGRSRYHSHNPRYRSNSHNDPAEVTLDPFTSLHAIAHHATGALAHTAIAEIHHNTDPHHIGISAKMTVDPEHINPTNTITKIIFQLTINTLEAQR